MQEFNTERKQPNVHLPGQLPANLIKETTSTTYQEHTNKNIKSAPNRFEKITGNIQAHSPLRRRQSDLGDFDTYRSLSSCPTYLSLSRESPETRECATQITTLTPTEVLEDNREILVQSPASIDDSFESLVDKRALMPISSGFGDYPYSYGTAATRRVRPTQIVARASQGKSNRKSPSPPRPTAVRRSLSRSDVSGLTTKRDEVKSKVPKNNPPPPNGFRRVPPRESVVGSPSPASQKRHAKPAPSNGVTRSVPKYANSSVSSQDLGRKPVRYVSRHPQASYSSPPPPAYHRRPTPVSRDTSEGPRRMRVANNNYIVQHRKQLPSDYIYDDYPTDSPIERTRPQRFVRMIREAPYQEDNDVYYAEPMPVRRARVPRKAPPPIEYVYVDETPPQRQSRHHRHAPRSDIVYEDDEEEDQPIEYEEDYVYVDEDDNEVEFINERNSSPEYVQYIYEDQTDRRRSRKPQVIYVDEDPPSAHPRRVQKKSRQPASTRIVYE